MDVFETLDPPKTSPIFEITVGKCVQTAHATKIGEVLFAP